MAETKPDLIITSDQFTSVNSAVNPPVAIGNPMLLQCKGTSWILLHESATQPASTVTDGVLITNLSYEESTKSVPSGSLEIWAICTNVGRTSKLSVQEV